MLLCFDSDHFVEIESDNSWWSMDFDNINEWKTKIQNSDGYLKAKDTDLLNYEIVIDET